MICVIGDKNFLELWCRGRGGGAGTGVQTLRLLPLSSCFLPLALKHYGVISPISPASHHFKLSPLALSSPTTHAPCPYSPRLPPPCFTSVGSITFPLN